MPAIGELIFLCFFVNYLTFYDIIYDIPNSQFNCGNAIQMLKLLIIYFKK